MVICSVQIHLARDLQNALEQMKQAENTRLMIEEEIRKSKLQSEADTVKQERVIRSLFDQKLQALQRDLDAANEELYQHRSIEKEACRLRDEVDLLSPTVKKVTKLEAALAKYKAKVEELPTLKEKLKVDLPILDVRSNFGLMIINICLGCICITRELKT